MTFSAPEVGSKATRSVKVPPTSTPTRRAVCSSVGGGIESGSMKRRLGFGGVATLAVSLVGGFAGCNSGGKLEPSATTRPLATTEPVVRAVIENKAPVAVAPATGAATGPLRVADAKTTLSFLASDELEGRGIGTRGLDRAADYIADEFRKAGLRPAPGAKDYFQNFEMTSATEVGASTALTVGDRKFEVNKDFMPVSISAEGDFEGAVVFAGYGIASEQREYDDYAGLDVKDKIVLVMRFEPHDEKGKSRFTGDDWSEEAHLTSKAKQAMDHGAAGVLLVTPPGHHEDEGLMPFARPLAQKRKVAMVQIKAAVADELLKRGGAPDLKTLQEKIDGSGKPASLALADVSVSGNVEIERKKAKVRNVVGLLPGAGPGANEYLVIGAHYDHLGYGGISSLAPTTRAIHNGADDNASGTTAIIQLAGRFASGPPPRRSMLFVAFTGEEEGLLGSEHFVDHPPVPLSDIVAMLNLDMVGRLKDETLQIGGNGTAAAFDPIIKKVDAGSPLKIKEIGKGGLGPSDHMAFGQKKIPVLFFFSGLHPDYHRPSDDVEKINCAGIGEIVDFVAGVAREVMGMPRQSYVAKFDSQSVHPGTPSRSRVTLGVVPDYSATDEGGGVRISGTSEGSPAAKAGLKEGDVITNFGDTKIDNLYDLSDALAKGKPGQVVKLKVRRGEQVVEMDATLAERK